MRIVLYNRRKRKVKKVKSKIQVQQIEETTLLLNSISIYEPPMEQKAFSILSNYSNAFEMGKINQKEDTTFIVLNRKQEEKCLLSNRVHHTCPSYLMIKDKQVYVGCYAKCNDIMFLGEINE